MHKLIFFKNKQIRTNKIIPLIISMRQKFISYKKQTKKVDY